MGLGLHREQSTHSGSDDRANAFSIGLRYLKARILHSLFGCNNAEFAKSIPAFGFFGFDQACRVKVFDFGREATGVF